MPKPAFKPYQQRQLMLLPPDISDLVPPDSVARVVDAVVEALDRERLVGLYPGGGAPAHDPAMMLKVVLYAYASGVYSSRKIARATRENVCFMWLTGMTPLDHMTVNRFRSERIRPAFEAIFTGLVALLAEKGVLDLSTYFLDGTKVEANANRYTFVWRKAVEGNRAKLQAKVRAHLEEVDRLCGAEESLAALLPEEDAEVTSGDVARVAGAINARLEGSPKSRPLKRAKRLVERDFLPRLEGYESRVAEIGGGRGSLSKTDPDATFMRMKEDHMGNGQLKAAYNVQVGTQNQVVVHATLHQRPGDTACAVPHLESLRAQFGGLPHTLVADAGYGSEGNYEWLRAEGVEAFVKYGNYHREQRPKFKRDPTKPKNWSYDEASDAYTCGFGRRLAFVCERGERSDLGHVGRTRHYRCEDCSGCPHRKACIRDDDGQKRRTAYINPAADAHRRRAEALLNSERGEELKKRRSTDVETVFGDIKRDFGFTRFTLRGLEKCTLEFRLVAAGHNIRKLHAFAHPKPEVRHREKAGA